MKYGLCVFGEVLFDHFPDGQRVLGGAPFNVAWNLQALGEPVHFISRVGDDPEGAEILEAMRSWHMETTGIEKDPELPTGRVSVELRGGEPSYDIVAPCAYDRIAPEKPSHACHILYHGSLALRDPVSRASLDQVLSEKPELVFVDVNLRPPWWQRQEILSLMGQADWVKLNTQELELLSGSRSASHNSATSFVGEHALNGLILTHGGAGAEVFTASGEHHRVAPESGTEVVDTVGAGDAFASVMLLGLARSWPLDLTLQRAQSFASALVRQRGATMADQAYYQAFIDNWN